MVGGRETKAANSPPLALGRQGKGEQSGIETQLMVSELADLTPLAAVEERLTIDTENLSQR